MDKENQDPQKKADPVVFQMDIIEEAPDEPAAEEIKIEGEKAVEKEDGEIFFTKVRSVLGPHFHLNRSVRILGNPAMARRQGILKTRRPAGQEEDPHPSIFREV
jgi:hypothetical protein